MNKIKVNFSIKDLEHLTKIKAHTIRIWEKRYNLLTPDRTETNIRGYSLDDFKKLLNIAYLNKNGLKISKIATLTSEEISAKVRELASRTSVESHATNALKVAMFNFDQATFYNTYNRLIEQKTFDEIFHTVFLPLLEDIGMLWQTNTITPAHEHFISVHIKQKILLNIERLQILEPQPDAKTFILFLPDHEIHDIGLLFIHYKLRSKGYHSIFLGESVPMDSLKDLLQFFNPLTFVSYFTVFPKEDNVLDYINAFYDLLLKNKEACLCLLGKQLSNVDLDAIPKNITVFDSIESLTKTF